MDTGCIEIRGQFVLLCQGRQLILGLRPSFLDVFASLEILALLTPVQKLLFLLGKLLLCLFFLRSQARRYFLFPIQPLLILRQLYARRFALLFAPVAQSLLSLN